MFASASPSAIDRVLVIVFIAACLASAAYSLYRAAGRGDCPNCFYDNPDI